MKAQLVRTLDGPGSKALYMCEPGGPLPQYVVVSAVVAMLSGPETYIFEANEAGIVQDWGELPGSYRGGLDHVAALMGAGYDTA